MSKHKEAATTENTAIIMAAESGYAFEGFSSSNYKVFCSYKHIGIILRCLRELWFKIGFLTQTPWYDKRILNYNPQYIIIRDAIITRKYLLWLQKQFPEAQINFMYENMVGKAKHLRPNEVPDGIRVWTYDKNDSIKYGIRLKQSMPYFSNFIVPKENPLYDVLFVGRDKGRGDWLHEFDLFLQDRGYKTKFVITKDSIYSKRKNYYQSEVPYSTIAEWISHAKCIINVGMDNQYGVTIRDLECLFNRIKMITTNAHIKEVYFYNPNNIFVLSKSNWDEVPMFLEKEYDNSVVIDQKLHSVQMMISEMTT